MNLIFRKNKLWVIMFLAPVTILFVCIMVLPLLKTFYYSFYEWNGMRTIDFRGLDNYQKLFTSREWRMALGNSLLYALILTIYQLGLGLLFAFILSNAHIRGKVIYRNIYFIPVLLSTTVVSQLWLWIYHGDYGLINRVAQMIGIEWRQQWLNQKVVALVAVAFVESWKNMGYIMLILYAAIRNIPDVYFEAARIDGASSKQQFFKIMLPLSAPTIRMALIMCVTQGFRSFEQIHLMTGGGPGIFTYNLSILMYKAMFSLNDFGYGSAVAMVIVVICVGFMSLINRLTRRFDEIY